MISVSPRSAATPRVSLASGGGAQVPAGAGPALARTLRLTGRMRNAASLLLLAAVEALGQSPPPEPAQATQAVATTPAPGDSVFSEEALRGLSIAVGNDDLGVELHGFVNLEYSALLNDPDHPHNSFDIHNVFLSTRGHVGTAVTAFIELEYEHGSQVKLDRAFIDLRAADFFTLRIGRFSVPLSYERIHYAAPVRLLTSRPMMADIAFHEWVDTGLAVYGRAGWFGYHLALVNGPRGLTEQGVPNLDVVDNNANKTVVARLNVYPTPFLEGGVAFAAGTYDPADLRWFFLAEADARLRHGGFDVWAEVAYRRGDDEPCSGADDPGCDPSYAGDRALKFGYSLLVSYAVIQDAKLIHYLRPILRFDELDDLAAKTGKRRITAGLNWSPLPHVVLKSELQWTFAAGASGPVAGVMASAVADF